MTLRIATDTLGDRLRRQRTSLNVQRGELGNRLGMSERQLRNYETGAERPGDVVILVLADALGLDAEELRALPTKEDPAGVRPDPLHAARVQAFANAPVGQGRAAAMAVTSADVRPPVVPAPVDTIARTTAPTSSTTEAEPVRLGMRARAIRQYTRIVQAATLPQLQAEVNDALGFIELKLGHHHFNHQPTVTFHQDMLGGPWAAIVYRGDLDLFVSPPVQKTVVTGEGGD